MKSRVARRVLLVFAGENCEKHGHLATSPYHTAGMARGGTGWHGAAGWHALRKSVELVQTYHALRKASGRATHRLRGFKPEVQLFSSLAGISKR
jgi:hypothetical protein